MRHPGTKGLRTHRCKGTGDKVHHKRSPAALHEDQATGATEGAHPRQSTAAGARVHPGAATSQARAGTHDNPPPGSPETEDILASIFNTTAPPADQGPQTEEPFHDDESVTAFMASFWDGAPNTGPTIRSALQRVSHDREPTSPAWDPASAFGQAHLRCNYAALGSAAETHAPTAGAGHAGGQPEGAASQRPGAQGTLAHDVQAPVGTGTVSGPMEGVPPRMTRPW